MPIRVLSEQLASQIAAGEVVERPASVVKELVENAIDAGATTINVDIRDGGRSLIQIADNGSGIVAEEVETAFLRHATSKLDSAESLAAIHTLGFRGEALAAIASVSQLTIVTRTKDGKSGIRLVLEGGNMVSRDKVGAPQGTVIAVENLFFNTPARLKFLKSITSEKRAIDEFLTRYALAYPSIRIRLTHNGRVTFQTSGNDLRRDALIAVYGADTGRQFVQIGAAAVDPETGEVLPDPRGIDVSGFIAPPGLHHSNRSHITLFVNGRWVKDKRLTYAVVQAYHTMLPTGRFPMALIFIELPAEDVDVNVHPMKTEVRFQRPSSVFGAVQKTVRNTLLDLNPVRTIDDNSPFQQIAGSRWQTPNMGGQPSPQWPSQSPAWPQQGAIDLPHPTPVPPVQSGAEMGRTAAQPAMPLGGERLPVMRVVGQIGSAYIITEGPDGMYLVDQHAAHERILYEQFLADWGQNGIAAQQLVTGIPVQMSPAQATLLEDQLALLGRVGFVVEPFGPNTFVVRQVPAILAKIDPARALMSVVEELERDAKPLQAKIEDVVIRRVCKTASIKAGQTLSQQEMEAMIRQLEACETPHTCPHGRPTLIHLSVAQLARQFGRL